jgi:cytidylate kinase
MLGDRMDTIIVAIDGPAGSGKTTVAKTVAKELKGSYLDTGAMYRAFACAVLWDKVDLSDEEKLRDIFSKHDFDFRFQEKDGQMIMEVWVDEKLLINELRTPEVDKTVSKIAKLPFVREKMVEWQREIAKKTSLIIIDGRDIGTVVFPEAQVKIFLTASPEERAKRRLKEKGLALEELEKIKKEIMARDKMDSEREVAPLKKASDAVLLDTSNLTLDEVVEKVKETIKLKVNI